jgi:hypothetical protein
MPLLDRNFKYVPASKTDVATTWRRFGFRPTTERERRARRPEMPPPPSAIQPEPPRFLAPIRRLDQPGANKLKLAAGKQ